MARIKARAGFGEASEYEALDINLDADEVRPEYIPAVTREVKVLDDDGNVVVEDGIERTQVETVTPARYESQEEALVRVLKEYLGVDEVTKSGLTNIRASINFTVTGTLDFDANDWGIDLDDFEVDPDDVDDYFVRENFEDTIIDAIREAARDSWDSELEFDVDLEEAE